LSPAIFAGIELMDGPEVFAALDLAHQLVKIVIDRGCFDKNLTAAQAASKCGLLKVSLVKWIFPPRRCRRCSSAAGIS
jgi:hypothetical protein